MIEIKNVTKRYGSNIALNNISFNVNEGEIFAFIGMALTGITIYAKGAKIYLKREDLNHTGAHKINNALGQILIAKRMNKTHIIAETGAGQHGVAVATVCALFNIKCTIFMGKEDIKRQAINVKKMELLGATIKEVLQRRRNF